jgi:hypothetical protein
VIPVAPFFQNLEGTKLCLAIACTGSVVFGEITPSFYGLFVVGRGSASAHSCLYPLVVQLLQQLAYALDIRGTTQLQLLSSGSQTLYLTAILNYPMFLDNIFHQKAGGMFK